MALISFKASIPSTLELCCVVAQIDESEIRDSSAKSHFHWKTMKCRLIIHTLRDHVIACPIFEAIASVYIITSVKFFNNENFRNTLKDMNMTWSTPTPVTPDVYANCLRYSIQFAIAPHWNRVGPYLINDTNFLSCLTNTAVKFNLTIQTGYDKTAESNLMIEPVKVHLSEIRLEEFDIPSEIIAHFMADPRGMIDVSSLGSHRVTVLPSLKQGRLLTIIKYIPPNSPFKNYGELRRHWKNMYGYRLPKTEHGIIYYDVYFPMPDQNRFLYPDLCVRSHVSSRPYLGNRELPIRTFLQDLSQRMPLVCGFRFQITTKNREDSRSDFSLEKNKSGLSNDSMTTPMNPPRLHSFCRNLNETSRLSFSSRHQLRRETSELMSPTPSLCGKITPLVRNPKFSNTLMTVDESLEKKQTSCPSDEKKFPEIQNRCPNDDSNFSGVKFSEMKPKAAANFSKVNELFSSSEVSQVKGETQKRKIPMIVNDDVLSKYFKKMKEGNQKICENIALLRGNTLSQKLERNLGTIKKEEDAKCMETDNPKF